MEIEVSKNVDPTTLAEALTAELGFEIDVSAVNREVDANGEAVHGHIVLTVKGERIPDQDSAVVAKVLAEHQPPPMRKTMSEQLDDIHAALAVLMAEVKPRS